MGIIWCLEDLLVASVSACRSTAKIVSDTSRSRAQSGGA